MTPDEELQDRLKELARAIPQQASAEIESRLRAQFRRCQHPRRLLRYVTGLAASLALAGGLYFFASHARDRDRPAGTTATSVEQTAGFVALPYAQSDVPMEQAVVVRVNLSTSELSAMGVPVAMSSPQNVRADLLVGQDGVARAVRLVQ